MKHSLIHLLFTHIPPSPKTLFIYSSHIYPPYITKPYQQTLFQVSHFSTSSSNPFHSSPNYLYPSRRHEEESRNVRVSVWWDFENCSLPVGANVFRVAQCITAAIRTNGIKGPIQITAFGDVMQISRSNQEALSSTGINITHIPNGGKNCADRSLLVDLMYWVSQNPPPAHLFLISGDRDFAGILHRLRMSNYNILLASPENASSVLCNAASIMWQWNALVRGESLEGKHFNQPPDGPHGSWYGHYTAPLDDPFTVAEQPASLRAELSQSCSDPKLRPIPRIIVKQIIRILNSYPKGITITDLHAELAKSNVYMDKDLYGYKKFSRFLQAMPRILKIYSGVDGLFFVRRIVPKVPEHIESTPGITTEPATNNVDADLTGTSKLNSEDSSCTGNVDEMSSLPLAPESNNKGQGPPTKLQNPTTKVQEPIARAQEPPKKGQVPPKAVEKVMDNVKPTENHLHSVKEHDSIPEVGFFERIWRKLLGSKDGSEESCSKPEKCSTAKMKAVEKHSASQFVDSVGPASFSSSSNESVRDNKIASISETSDEKSGKDLGFLKQIVSRCKFWKTTSNTNNFDEQPSEKVNQKKIDSEKVVVFSKESFWNDMETFMDTPGCSDLFLQSKTRVQLAQNLQKQGPLVLKTLSEIDLLRIVDILISDKKWVEECDSQVSPYKLIQVAEKSSKFSNPPSNGLRSLFVDTPLQSSTKRLQEHEGRPRQKNLPRTGVPPTVVNRSTFGKSRGEILGDCHKLVDEIVKEYPEGFNMGSFNKLFLQRYGYSLDIKKLGFDKLATFLRIMPGVNIDSTYIIPSFKVTKGSVLETDGPVQENNVSGTVTISDSELSDASRKDDDLDSPWEELGPVANTGPKRNEQGFGLSKKVQETVGQMHQDYETSIYDYLSDSEEENLSSTRSEGQGKSRNDEEDSSLLQILNSWYSSKEDNCRRNASGNVDGMAECSTNDLKQSASSAVGTNSKAPVVNYGRKQRAPNSYLFVSDQPGDGKDKLIDGILGSFKKSGEKSVESSI